MTNVLAADCLLLPLCIPFWPVKETDGYRAGGKFGVKWGYCCEEVIPELFN